MGRFGNLKKSRIGLEIVLVFLATLAAVAAIQIRNGAYGADFWDDEASHYTTGMMIRAYLLHRGPWQPLDFLKQFHAHYPLVGLGHWGPVFYVVEGMWLLAFGPSPAAALALTACIAAGLATLLYHLVARRYGRWWGCALALVLLFLPLMQRGENDVMLDLPIALLTLAAALAYARFLHHPGLWRWPVLFGFFAAAAMLVKGNGIALGLLPPFAILFGRRFDLLRRINFWIPLAIVGILAGPWTIATYKLVAAGFRFPWGMDYTAMALSANAATLYANLGPALLALGVLGIVLAVLRHNASGQDETLPVAMAALFSAVWVFQALVPSAIEDRYLAPDLVPLLFLAARAGDWLLHLAGTRRDFAPLAALAAALSTLPATAPAQPKPVIGIKDGAAALMARLDPANPSVLAAGDSLGESAEVAALVAASADRTPLFVVRGSRLLGGGGYNNEDYEPRYQTEAEVADAIARYHIRYVLLRVTGQKREWRHVAQVAELGDRWHLLFETTRPDCGGTLYPGQTLTCRLRLYEIPGVGALPDGGRALLQLSAPMGMGGG